MSIGTILWNNEAFVAVRTSSCLRMDCLRNMRICCSVERPLGNAICREYQCIMARYIFQTMFITVDSERKDCYYYYPGR
jgi:hypothetical protein